MVRAPFSSATSGGMALAADVPPLVNQVAAALGRLAQLGWQQLLLDVTGGEFDIGAANLKSELIKPLAKSTVAILVSATSMLEAPGQSNPAVRVQAFFTMLLPHLPS